MEGLASVGPEPDPGLLMALAVIVVVPVVWGGVRHLRHALRVPEEPGTRGLLSKLVRRRGGCRRRKVGPGAIP